jgi:predicted metal-dependent peptidase
MIDNLTKAKTELVLTQPFFASLLFGLAIEPDEKTKTLSVDGETIRYNPEFLNTLTIQEIVFVLAHETMHCAMGHMYRKGNRDHKKFNQAADYAINEILVNDRVGRMPQGGLQDSQLYNQGGGSAEGIYDILPDNPSGDKGNPGDSDSGGSLDEILDAPGDEAEQIQKEAEQKVKLIQAANVAKMHGKLSAGLSRIVGEAVKTKVNWRDAMRRFFSERSKETYSYARPKRRFIADDIYLPGLTGEKLGEIVIAVDCSGSINNDMLNRFSSEIQAIMAETSPSKIHVMYFDSQVLKVESFDNADELKLEPLGGGGTAFSPIFKAIESQAINPTACVVLTDLCCDDYGNAPGYPVLWACTERSPSPVPFGDVLSIVE